MKIRNRWRRLVPLAILLITPIAVALPVSAADAAGT